MNIKTAIWKNNRLYISDGEKAWALRFFINNMKNVKDDTESNALVLKVLDALAVTTVKTTLAIRLGDANADVVAVFTPLDEIPDGYQYAVYRGHVCEYRTDAALGLYRIFEADIKRREQKLISQFIEGMNAMTKLGVWEEIADYIVNGK